MLHFQDLGRGYSGSGREPWFRSFHILNNASFPGSGEGLFGKWKGTLVLVFPHTKQCLISRIWGRAIREVEGNLGSSVSTY